MNIISAVKHGLEALRVGKSLANVEAWKNEQAIISFLVAAVAIIRALGVDFGIDNSTLAAAGVAITALVNAYLTFATSKKVGFPANKQPSLYPFDGREQDETTPIAVRKHSSKAMANQIVSPANVSYYSAHYNERMPDNPKSLDQSNLDEAKNDQSVPESGWNDR